ncbi:MAG TPA: RNA polymerase sigma factor [Acidobacteriota bacterium]|nr:RNA polymerase sigma factor [Acidobacteriota bacterium]
METHIRTLIIDMAEPADAALIENTLKGDESAFAELIRRYQAAVWGTVHRILGSSSEGEDAVQEIFLRVFSSLRRFDLKYPFGPWILRIATNYCIDLLRRRKARKYKLWTDLSEGEQQKLMNEMSVDGDFDSRSPETYERVARELLNELKPKYRTAFVLREVEGRDYREVASALGTSELAARVRVSRARSEIQKKFRAFLGGSGTED